VRAQRDAVGARELRHPRQVAVERIAIEDEYRGVQQLAHRGAADQ
jgi:hypothetical protein